MDRKSIIILVISAVVLMTLYSMVDRIFPPPKPNEDAMGATNVVTNAAGSTETNPAPSSAGPAPAPTPLPALTPSAPEKTLTLSNQNLVFSFTSRGGGLQSVALTNFPSVFNRKDHGAVAPENRASLNALAAVPILAVLGEGMEGDNDFALTQYSNTHSNLVRAEKTFTNGLKLVKQFQLALTGTNYIFYATVHFENTGRSPLDLARREIVIGSATPVGPMDDPTSLGAIWYNGNKWQDIGARWFANRTLGCFPGTPHTEYEDGASNVVWAATHSQFFALAAIPSRPAEALTLRPISLPLADTSRLAADGGPAADWGYNTFPTNQLRDAAALASLWSRQRDPVSAYIWRTLSSDDQAKLSKPLTDPSDYHALEELVVAQLNKLMGGPCWYDAERFRGVVLRQETTELMRFNPSGSNLRHLNLLLLEDTYPQDLTRNPNSGYQTAFAYPFTKLAPGQSLDYSFTFYAGPKEYNGLAKIGQFMGNHLDDVMGFTGYFGFGFFSRFLLISMTTLYKVIPQYGLCIIAITGIIKLIFWPMMVSSTRSQKKLQALQPQLKAIADKYKDDPLKRHERTTAFLKENKVNPMGSCLPLLIQLPVFYGFYSMLRNAIELRGTPFLWAPDLTQPDTICSLAGFPINPLPLIMGVTQLWQAHLTPPQPGMDPGQQKIMRFMPILFIAFFYRMSSGLTLYWTVSNLLTILQTKMTRMVVEPGAPAAAVTARKKK